MVEVREKEEIRLDNGGGQNCGVLFAMVCTLAFML